MIELTDIHKRYGNTEVLRGVSMNVRRGEVTVLLGPSGGGKSTLLRTINALEAFDHGRIQIDDLQLRPGENSEVTIGQIRQRVGMVFQQFNLFPHLTVLQNVIEAPRQVRRVPAEQAEEDAIELLRRVGMGDKLYARPATLSGGQQQRVAIARSLAMHPKAILFDEPTSALDPRMTSEVTAVLADLASSGQTMIVVTHAIGFARRVADTVHILHDGKIAESGSPEQVLESPTHEVTQSFLADSQSAHD